MSIITLLPAQKSFTAGDEESVLDAALRAGINLPHSCKSGHCTSCRAHIVAGEIRYPRGRPLGLLEEEERRGDVLLCQARALTPELTVRVREVRRVVEIAVKSLPCRIERLRLLAPDVAAVDLRLPANEQFSYLAGQYIDVLLPQNRRRSFSIANAPRPDPIIELHIRRAIGGEFTEPLFTGGKEKSLLRIEGPLGQFFFRNESARPAILIGGGTGYAPLRAMIQQLLASGDGRTLHLYWGVRSRVDLYDDRQVREWSEAHANLSYTPVLSTPSEEDRWDGATGWVHRAVLANHPQLAAHDVYASGPPAMIEAIRAEFLARGLPPEQLFFDSFDYAPDTLEKRVTGDG